MHYKLSLSCIFSETSPEIITLLCSVITSPPLIILAVSQISVLRLPIILESELVASNIISLINFLIKLSLSTIVN